MALKPTATDQNAGALAWQQLLRCPARDLRVGDRWVVLEPFTTYIAASDGSVYGHGYMPPTGTIWRLLTRDGDTFTAADQDGCTATQAVPSNTQVLKIQRAN